MHQLKVIAHTHKNLDTEKLGDFYLDETAFIPVLSAVKEKMKLTELLYLSTCNRVEFIFSNETPLSPEFSKLFLSTFLRVKGASTVCLSETAGTAEYYSGKDAVAHFFRVASSLDSMVVGEREIITQVRNAYQQCRAAGLTGDLLRLLVTRTIETAKRVYTETAIAQKPVSVVSLAYRKLKELQVDINARFLIIGAGKTNSSMAKFLKKHGFCNFVLFNRTLSNAEQLVKELDAKLLPLNSISSYNQGFDVIISCTGAKEFMITPEIYKTLLCGDTSRKIVIDLAVPNDFDPTIAGQHSLNLITVNNLRNIAQKNYEERKSQLFHCEQIIEKKTDEFLQTYRERQVELAMREVPEIVKEIKNNAINYVFAKELDTLDDDSRQVLNKVLEYVEKKYISVPMKMAKEILINNKQYKIRSHTSP